MKKFLKFSKLIIIMAIIMINLIEYLLSKEVIISNKEDALMKIERYTYYSIINTYKAVFKNEDGTTSFIVSSDEEVLPVSYVIEDILKLY